MKILNLCGGVLSCMLLLSANAALGQTPAGQVTYGKKPQLPRPFATQSAGNGPGKENPPAGFLPTVPSGFHINIFAKDFSVPRI